MTQRSAVWFAAFACSTLLCGCAEKSRVDRDRSAPAATGEQNRESSEPPAGEQWKREMERTAAMPSAGSISIIELDGRLAFASTRAGPHTVFVLPLGSAAELKRMNYGHEPSWSPDGTLIAYTASYLDGGDDITLMDADGGNVRRLTTGERQDRGASWSPDGRSIAFWAERGDQRDIHVVDLDGSTRQLTSDSHPDMWPDWSPDGEIAYETYRGDGAEIFRVAATGGEPQRLTPKGLDAREPAWSPDGSEIAFVSSTAKGWSLGVISADGKSLRKLIETKALRNPEWSPDGRFLVFACQPEGTPNEDICIVDTRGERLLQLSFPEGFDWDPSWTKQ